MLKPEYNERLVRVGPGKPAGELMRRAFIARYAHVRRTMAAGRGGRQATHGRTPHAALDQIGGASRG